MKYPNFALVNRTATFRIGGIVLIATLGAFIYANHLHNPFQFDTVAYLEKQNLSDPESMLNLRFFTQQFFSRGLLQMSLAVNALLGSNNPFGYHLFNLTFHIINAILIFLVSENVIRKLANRQDLRPHHVSGLSLFAGLLFLSHPMQTESVLYIMSRSEILAATFYLLAFYSFQRWLASDSGKPPSLLFCWAWTAVGGLFLLGFGVKQTLITLPATLFLYFLCVSPTNSRTFLFIKRWKWLLAAIVFVVLTLLLHKLLSDETFLIGPVNAEQMVGRKNYMQTQPWVLVFYYFRLLLFPVNLNIDPDIPLVTHLFSLPALSSLALIALALYLAVRKTTARVYVFCLGWYGIILSPSSSIVTLHDLAAEHRVYLAAYGVFLMLILLAWKTRQLFTQGKREFSPFATAALAITVLGSLSLMTVQRNFDWKSETALWEDTRKKSPHLVRPLINLARAHHLSGNTETAVRIYQASLQRAPDVFIANYNLGELQFIRGQFEEALKLLTHALRIKPRIPEVHGKLGELFQHLGQHEKAARHYQTAVELNPKYVTAMRNLGVLHYYHLNNPELGRLYFSRALTLDPNQPQAAQMRTLIRQPHRP